MPDREMTEFLAGVVGVVDANSYEKLCLWQEYHEGHKKEWKQRSDGLLEIVGHLDDMPVCLNLTTAEVDGHKLLFIDPTSQVIDYRMIDKWLIDNLPRTARKLDRDYINRTDAMNFHNVFPRKSAAA